MPMYTFVNGDEKTRKFYPMGKAPRKIKLEGRTFHRQMFPDFTNSQGSCGTWPQRSLSNAVLPNQVERAMRVDKDLGVPIRYTKKGEAIFDSRPQKQRWLKAHRRVDHDAGYGDPSPGGY